MTYRKICSVHNNQVIVILPPNFENRKQVTITIDDKVESKVQKMAQIKEASLDPLFLADILEINNDFDSIN
ncbi:MAG: hypothetical protein IPK03_14140 [Bacteroidetes bacterium]|nr:hypothetical protein [Bacteroidota bacterium]